jgi:Holliday junction resolvase RusA-like endonuclease
MTTMDIYVDGTPRTKGSDITTALRLMTAIQDACEFDPQWVTTFRHDGAPKSKARARVVVRHGKTMSYTPQTTRVAEDELAWRWKLAMQGKTIDGPVAVVCVFFRPNRQRIDADNMTKLVLDAGTKARVWHDDSQVVMIVARVEFDPGHPRTEIAIADASSTLDREMFKTATCPTCAKEFTRKTSAHVSNSKRADYMSPGGYCSNACVQGAKRVMARCRHCSKDFVRKKAGQALCSNECKVVSASVRFSEAVSLGKRRGHAKCEQCGGRVSRREYKRCSDCSPKGRAKGSKNKPKPSVVEEIA